MANRMVLRSDFQNVSSANSRVKLSKPMNFAGCGETSCASVNASVKVRAIGMIMKVSTQDDGRVRPSSAATVALRPALAPLPVDPGSRRPVGRVGDCDRV